MLRAPQLNTFLEYCEAAPVKKEVLECGAGCRSDLVPLFARFAARGYAVRGIEVSKPRLDHARAYCDDHGIDADLRIGDMRNLPYADGSIPFVFAYNTIFHMPKGDIARSMMEIRRVLPSGGYCFVNFASVDDHRYGDGEEVEPGVFRQRAGDDDSTHSFYDVDEADALHEGLVIEHRERRVLTHRFRGRPITLGYIDYIARVP